MIIYEQWCCCARLSTLFTSFSFFCKAYFSLCRSRQRTHLVARPFSPKEAHGRKFLQPLHHLIWSKSGWREQAESITTHTFTSQLVHNPLFCYGIMGVGCKWEAPVLAACCWALCCKLARDFLPWDTGHIFPHITQIFEIVAPLLSPEFRPNPEDVAALGGKLTKFEKSGGVREEFRSISPSNLLGGGCFKA